jgi:ferredoxin
VCKEHVWNLCVLLLYSLLEVRSQFELVFTSDCQCTVFRRCGPCYSGCPMKAIHVFPTLTIFHSSIQQKRNRARSIRDQPK